MICAGTLPIVNVSIFINMAPLFTVILAVWILKERLTLFNFIQAIFSFLGVFMIIIGRNDTSSSEDPKETGGSDIVYWIMLVICPVIIAVGEFQTSKISKASEISPYFLPYWSNAIMMILFGSMAYVSGSQLP